MSKATTSTKPKCNKGTACGFTCISGKYICSSKILKRDADALMSNAISNSSKADDLEYKLPDGVGNALPETESRHVVSDKDVLAKAQSNLEALLAAAELRINISGSSLLKVIKSGRFKNTHETGTSGGELGGNARGNAESKVLGVSDDTPAEFKPIYGTLADSKVSALNSHAGMYGDVEVVLKDSVRKRSTFTIEDSFMNFEYGDTEAETEFVASRLSNPRIGPTVSNYYSTKLSSGAVKTANDMSSDTYTELQIHGGVKLSDIDFIRIPAETNEDYGDLEAKLTAAGIKYSRR